VVGHFNEIIRGKVLIVVNEVENAKTNPRSASEKLRSLITDDIVAIGQKYKATTLDVNYANFIMVSNNDVFFLFFFFIF
jgi:phage/plasmid-associated DNA primase